MRTMRVSLLASAVLLLCLDLTAATPHAIRPRQNDDAALTSAEASATTNVAVLSSSTTERGASSSATEEVEKASATETQALSTTVANLLTSVPVQTATNTQSTSQTASSNSEQFYNYAETLAELIIATVLQTKRLPFEPTITPALVITGVLLLLAGVAYTFVGLKNTWLYISLSVAFLGSLGVTVLLVYIQKPPVSDAMQGAYFVAACVSGLVLGGLALVFQEVTDVLACPLGGFCLAMWFLVLKDGSLIESKLGRAIFIVAFTVVAFAASFSRYTRHYALLGSIAFAGATAIILGVDCFTRAGLKEFWLYVWDINPDIFPLNSDGKPISSFPLTRGITVEVACIIIFAMFGVISQMRLWKTIKESRERLAADRREELEAAEQRELEDAKRLEEGLTRERAEWEAVYGDKRARATVQEDSGFGSSKGTPEKTPKTSVDLLNVDHPANVECIEMTEREVSTKDAGPTDSTSKPELEGRVVTINVAAENDVAEMDAEDRLLDDIPAEHQEEETTAVTPGTNKIGYSDVARASNSITLPPPMVVPLPFRIPEAVDAESDDSQSSTGSVAETVAGTELLQHNGMTGRFAKHTSKAIEEHEGDALIPYVEDDRASSVAATMDDLTEDDDDEDLPPLSRPVSYVAVGQEDDEASPTPTVRRVQSGSSLRSQKAASRILDLQAQAERVDSAQPTPEKSAAQVAPRDRSLTCSTNPGSRKKPHRLSRLDANDQSAPQVQDSIGGSSNPDTPHRKLSAQSSAYGSEAAQSPVSLRKSTLPSGLSKIATSYRTNEWAKHLEAAEKPGPEELAQATEGGIKLERVDHEVPAPVVVEDLRQTGAGPQRRAMSPTVLPSSADLRRLAKLGHKDFSQSRVTLHDPQPGPSRSKSPDVNRILAGAGSKPYFTTKNPSLNNVLQTDSQARLMTHGMTSVSMPYLNQPEVGWPVEEHSRPISPRVQSPPPAEFTLLGQRDQMLRDRISTMNFNSHNPHASTPNLAMLSPKEPSPISQALLMDDSEGDDIPLRARKQALDAGNMTLAQWKALMQQQQGFVPSPETSRQTPPPLRQWASAAALPQPVEQRPTNTQRQAQMLATWRQSVRQDLAVKQPHAVLEHARRAQMMNDIKEAQLKNDMQAAARSQRESAFDNLMRSGTGVDAHREVLRRMQAKARQQ